MEFGKIAQGQTFYRKVFDHIHIMVKANDKVAVMKDDVPASMRGEQTPFWEIDANEVMLPEAQMKAYKQRFPDRVKTSSSDL